MSLENKIPGDKHFAFEVNGIMKAIRNLFGNFLDKWGYLGSVSLTGTETIPKNCNFIIITCLQYGNGRPFAGDVILTRYGKTTGRVAGQSYYTAVADMTFYWSGDTLTSGGYASATAYYYS